LEGAAHGLQPDVTGCGPGGHVTELTFDTYIRRRARQLEVGPCWTRDPTLDVAAPRDLDRAPPELVLLLDPHDVASGALVHRDLDLLDRVTATATESHDLDGRPRLVGRRDHDASTRELDLEGDTPGSVERVHRRPP